VAEPATDPKPGGKTATTALLDTTLGDLLLAGIVKDPGAAGHIIAEALAQTEIQPTAPGRKAAIQAIAGPPAAKSPTSPVTDDHAAEGAKK
jgi:hypothetical protein